MIRVPGHLEEALVAGTFRHAYLMLLPGHYASPHGRVTILQDTPTVAARQQASGSRRPAPSIVDEGVFSDRTDRLEAREGVLTALRYVLDIDLGFFSAMVSACAEDQPSFRRLVEYADAITAVTSRRAVEGAPVYCGPSSTADLEGELRRRIANACDASSF